MWVFLFFCWSSHRSLNFYFVLIIVIYIDDLSWYLFSMISHTSFFYLSRNLLQHLQYLRAIFFFSILFNSTHVHCLLPLSLLPVYSFLLYFPACGAKTPLSKFTTLCVVLIALSLLTNTFYFIPQVKWWNYYWKLCS